MDREKIICVFCGRIAKIKEQDDLNLIFITDVDLALILDLFLPFQDVSFFLSSIV